MLAYTTRQAANLTGLSVRALRKRIERGALTAEQSGRFWRISHEALVAAGLTEPLQQTPRTRADLVVAPLEQQLEAQRLQIERLSRRRAELEVKARYAERLREQLAGERQAREQAQAAARGLMVQLATDGERRRLLSAPPSGALPLDWS